MFISLIDFDVNFGSQVLREGMGQASNIRNDVALDTVITNVVIIDAVLGVIKADVGIKVNRSFLICLLYGSFLGWCHCWCRESGQSADHDGCHCSRLIRVTPSLNDQDLID